MRALGLDLGSRRIGVAISDSQGAVATPIDLIERGRRRADDHRRVDHLVTEWEAEVVVVGVPYSLDGHVGPAAAEMLQEADQLGDVLTVPVRTYDERLTTVTAERSLMELRLNAQDRRRVVDQVAAAVMLQGWLDHERST